MTSAATSTRPTVPLALRMVARHGFDERDRRFGEALARIPHDDWPPKLLGAAHRLLRNYETWLSAHGVLFEEIALPGAPEAPPERKVPEIVAPSGLRLRPFQAEGVRFAEARKRVLIADEPGLGKSVQSLVCVERLGAYPHLVVCPPALVLNWAAEAEKWVPERRVRVVSGGSDPVHEPGLFAAPPEIVVVSDALPKAEYGHRCLVCEKRLKVDDRADPTCPCCGGSGIVPRGRGKKVWRFDALGRRLRAYGFKSVTVDELHRMKNRKAQRSIAAHGLTDGIEVRIGLTGTPLPNKPVELAHQLDILGRLEDLGGYWVFARRFCAAHRVSAGKSKTVWDFDGSSNLTDLNKELRETFYIRRRKEDVLKELPPVQWATVWLPLDNEADYKRAERDFVGWLLERGNDDKALAASRAEEITRLMGLWALAGKGKVAAAREWARDLLESGGKLAMFAHHVPVQDGLAWAAEGCARIRGGAPKDEVEAEKKRFEGDGCDLIVCSIEAGGLGHTLHAGGRCSTVALAQLPWTPAGVDQCWGRVHRIGQTAERVTVYLLLARGTIDERMSKLIEAKRRVIDAAVDGKADKTFTGASIENELIADYRSGR